MAIQHWYPFEDTSNLENRVNFLLRELTPRGAGQSGAQSILAPVDIYEDEHKLTLKLDLPGFKEEDLDIRVEDQTLTVKGERKLENEEKEKNFHRMERSYGTFTRTFTLPATVDTSDVNASYNAGVLKLELARKAEAKPRQIKVQTAAA